MIPSGPIQYDQVTYAPEWTTMDEMPMPENGMPSETAAALPAASVSHVSQSGYLNLNAWSSNYQVRGMGVTDELSHYGYSSLRGSYTLPNRNLFGRGIQQRLGGEIGSIWGADDPLGDTPLVRFDYAIGKEVFPNAVAEVGYSLHHGGLEGLLAHGSGKSPHRLTQDFNVACRYDDHQKGFFGHALWGIGFQGLTGSFFDAELGYRFTGVLNFGNLGADAEISAGIAPSLGYWGGGVEGVDAYRVTLALPLFTYSGTLGHDAHPYLRPWVSASWSGCNAGKIDRVYGNGAVDHAQFSFGVDCGWNF